MTINVKSEVQAMLFFLYQRGGSIFRYGNVLTTQLLTGSLVSIFTIVYIAGAQDTTAIHMATNGLDNNSGTLESPVVTLPKAIQLAECQTASCEIVVHGGTYFPEEKVSISYCSATKDRKLVIRSADNETAVFDASILVDKAEPLAGAPGVYAIKGDFPSDEPPPVWEESTGIHFLKLAGLESVKHKDYSSVVLDPRTLALRYKDGRSPAKAGIRMSRAGVDCGFQIYRDNVTVKGIEFKNFCLRSSASAIRIGEARVSVKVEGKTVHREGILTTNTFLDSCSAYNCHKGFWVCTGASNAVLKRCRARNSITGIRSSGIDVIVEDCLIMNDPDWLLDKVKGADFFESTGIILYGYCTRNTVRNNIIKGFPNGIFSKNCWGPFFIEHNTLLGQSLLEPRGYAIRPHMGKDYHVRYNVFAGFFQLFGDVNSIPADADIDYNVFWRPEYNFSGIIKGLQKKGVGPNNVFADPFFASPSCDDYRLLPGSPAICIHADKNAGAFPQVPDEYKGAPNLRVSIGHKKDVQTSDSFPPSQLPLFSCYVSNQRIIEADLAVSSVATVKKTRLQVNDGQELEKEFKPSDTFELPDKDGLHTLCFKVQDVNGAWSGDSVIYVFLRRRGVQLIGEPKIITNRYGALISFKADRYAWGKLEYYAGDKWIKAADSADLSQNSEGLPEDYGAYREFSSLPLLVAGLAPDMPQRYRLKVTTPLDSTVREGTFVLSGNPKIIYVATTGLDSEGEGSRKKPFRTLQFAFDRALPGDRVRIMPGVYFGAHILNHGGTKEHPLVIEGLYQNTVILDGLREAAVCLRVDHAPYIILRNLNFQWFKGTGISAGDSEGVRVSGCRFHNQYWQTKSLPIGMGIIFSGSPNFMVDHCIFSRFWVAGQVFDGSSGGQIIHNTATACAVSFFQWRSISRPNDNITIKYNSLHWNADQLLHIAQPLDTLLNKCAIDYNNYGTTFQQEEGTPVRNGKYGRSLPKPFQYLPNNRELQYYLDTVDLSNGVTHVFVNMKDWQEFSGQDKYSIFADPKWIDPKAGRFDVAADSPNLLPDGRIIGALGYLGKNQNMAPEVVVTAPYSGEEVKAGFTVSAAASDYDGAIKKVEFYADDKLIGTAADQPYQITEVKLSQGCHAITAKAIDDKGAVIVSDEVNMMAK